MNPGQEAAYIRQLYWTSFALRFCVGLAAWFLTDMLNFPIMEDALGYSERGAEVARDWMSGQPSWWLNAAMEEGRQAWFMVATLAVIYCLTGGIQVLPLALGVYCLLTAFTPLLAYRAGRQLGLPADGALTAARLIAYSPAFAFWSSALYKEGLVLFMIFLIIEHTLRLQQSFRLTSVAVLGASLVALFGLRFYIAAILCVALLAGVGLGRSGRISTKRVANGSRGEGVPPLLRQMLVIALLLSVFSFIGLGDRVQAILSVGFEENLERINTSRQDLSSYGSGYLASADVSTVDKALTFLPAGFAYFLVVPLPWQLGSFRQNLAIPETLFWVVVVYPRVVRGIWRGAQRNPQGTAFLALSAIVISAFYALFIGNIGTAYRMRIQVWAIMAIFAGWGWRRVESTHATPARSAAPLQPARIPRSASKKMEVTPAGKEEAKVKPATVEGAGTTI